MNSVSMHMFIGMHILGPIVLMYVLALISEFFSARPLSHASIAGNLSLFESNKRHSRLRRETQEVPTKNCNGNDLVNRELKTKETEKENTSKNRSSKQFTPNCSGRSDAQLATEGGA